MLHDPADVQCVCGCIFRGNEFAVIRDIASFLEFPAHWMDGVCAMSVGSASVCRSTFVTNKEMDFDAEDDSVQFPKCANCNSLLFLQRRPSRFSNQKIDNIHSNGNEALLICISFVCLIFLFHGKTLDRPSEKFNVRCRSNYQFIGLHKRHY